MPLFEYQCTACGHRFEQLEWRREFELPRELCTAVCPQCTGVAQRQVSAPTIGGLTEGSLSRYHRR